MRGFQAAARQPTNLAKVSDVQQDKAKSPAAFLEQVLEAYRTYTPMNPEAPENKNAIILTFVNQSAPDIRHKLQKLDRLADRSLQELLAVAENVFNHRETPEERQTRMTLEARAKQTRQLAKILLASSVELPEDRARQLRRFTADPGKRRPTGGCSKLQKTSVLTVES
jgi:predicted component of type VI protein secretion system